MSSDVHSPVPVLIVEDDAVSRLVLGHMLRRMGYEVADADSVSAALSRYDECPPALVISDFILPDGTGLDVLSGVREKPSPPPFVLITGEGEQTGLEDSRSNFIDGYLTKPVGSRELLVCIERLFAATRAD